MKALFQRQLQCFCLFLLTLQRQQVGGSSPNDCPRRPWRWQRTQLCPPTADPSAAAVLQLPTQHQCILVCTLRLPMCKAAHFKDSVCSLAVNFTQLSFWSIVGLGQCSSLMLAPVLLQLLAFFDFRESIEKATGSANISSESFDVTRDSSGLHFAGRMTSFLKLSIPGGLTALTDRDGERAVSFFMKVRRPYKTKSVFMKITSDSNADVCNLYENDGDLVFKYSHLGKQFTSTSKIMQTDTDSSGFFLGVAASNITGAFAFIDNRVFSLGFSTSNAQVVDSLIRLGYSSSTDDGCLSGIIVCFSIAQSKLSAEQFTALALVCD